MNDVLEKLIAQCVSTHLGFSEEEVLGVLEMPQNAGQGDRAFPCFRYAKTHQKSPQLLAQLWASQMNQGPLPKEISRIENSGGYINFFANDEWLSQTTLRNILENPKNYGRSPKNGQKVIVEFSSPNIAKPFSIGHLRSTNLGASLARIMEACGFEVVRMNHLGDWGTQFGKLMVAQKLWGTKEIGENPLMDFYNIYVKFHEEEEKNPQLTEEARAWFAKLEQGDSEAKNLWNWFREITLKEVKKIYSRLGVSFDHYWGESFYIPHLPRVFSELKNKKLMHKSDNAQIVDLKDYKLSVSVIQKNDESSLYITRDLAAAIYRKEKLNFDHMFYVVGAPQQLHFGQLFKILELLGYAWSKECELVQFGQITFGDQKMSTRKGNIVFLEDVLNEAKKEALIIINEKNPTLENKDTVAEQVALGAVLFADVSAKRIKDIKFEWKDILSFDGETGPYVQYTFVRINSLLEKIGHQSFAEASFKLLNTKEENDLVRVLSLYGKKLIRAQKEREPFVVAQYLIEVCKSFNRFYHEHRLQGVEDNLRAARGALVQCVQNVLSQGMEILGLPRPQKM